MSKVSRWPLSLTFDSNPSMCSSHLDFNFVFLRVADRHPEQCADEVQRPVCLDADDLRSLFGISDTDAQELCRNLDPDQPWLQQIDLPPATCPDSNCIFLGSTTDGKSIEEIVDHLRGLAKRHDRFFGSNHDFAVSHSKTKPKIKKKIVISTFTYVHLPLMMLLMAKTALLHGDFVFGRRSPCTSGADKSTS